jgi:hypothetical protein
MPAEAVERKPPVLPASQIGPFKAYCIIKPVQPGRLGMRRRDLLSLLLVLPPSDRLSLARSRRRCL